MIRHGQPPISRRPGRGRLSADDFEDGREIWRREQPAGSWAAAGVRIGWLGPGAPDCLLVYSRGLVTCEWQGDEMLYRYVPGEGEAIFDGDGNLLETLTMQ